MTTAFARLMHDAFREKHLKWASRSLPAEACILRSVKENVRRKLRSPARGPPRDERFGLGHTEAAVRQKSMSQSRRGWAPEPRSRSEGLVEFEGDAMCLRLAHSRLQRVQGVCASHQLELDKDIWLWTGPPA